MQNNCWNNSQLSGNPTFDTIAWVENAYELLDTGGEWYLNRSTGYLYYIPVSGENMSTAEVVAPKLQSLLSGAGTLDAPIHHIQMTGLTFAYATWLQPNTSEGYVPLQAGFNFTGVHTVISNFDVTKTPASVTFHAAKSIRLERNVFRHLGGAGLNLEYGSQNNTIVGNVFEDISSSGIQVGDVTAADINPADSRAQNRYNAIQNNYITNVAAEYFDTVGIFGGYASYSSIAHNEVSNLPYSGISQGWGWGTNSYAQNNDISYNLIHDHMSVLADGGGIYTLSSQPGSTMTNNYIYNQTNGGGSIYLDIGTQYYQVNNNVLTVTPNWIRINPGTPTPANNTVQYNYSNTNHAICCSGNTANNNTVITNGNWPTAAQNIMENAGIESAYQDIKAGINDISNLSWSQATSASSVYPGHIARMGNDGDSANNGWSPTGSDTLSWWQVDLGAAYTITRIHLYPRQGLDQPETRQNFEIRASNDPAFTTYTVLASQGNTPFAHQTMWLADVKNSQTFRYIRAAKTANEYFWVTELQVMGYSPTTTPPSTNLSLSKTASASTALSASYTASRGNDGSAATGWSPTGADTSPWWQVDLGAAYTVTEIYLISRQNLDQSVTRQNFEIRASNDPTFATYTVLASQGSTPFAHQATWSANVNNSNTFRYIRAAKTASEYFWVTELQVMGY